MLSFVGDVSTDEGAASIVNAAVERFGKLDICVNNAAVAPHASIFDERSEVWDTVYSVNTRGTFLMTRAAAKAMIDAGNGGRIINFSSGVTTRGSAGAGAYASSRAATESFSRVAAIELAPHNILVNVVSPGLIDTQPKPLPPRMAEGLGKRIPNLPLARPGESEEVGIGRHVPCVRRLELCHRCRLERRRRRRHRHPLDRPDHRRRHTL